MMKKIIFAIIVVLFIATTLLIYNIQFTSITSLDYLLTNNYNYVYTAINQGVYGSMLGNSSYGLLNNYGLQSKYIQPLGDGSTDDIGFSESDKYYQIKQYIWGIKLDDSAREECMNQS